MNFYIYLFNLSKISNEITVKKQKAHKLRKTQRMEEETKADQRCQPIFVRHKADLAGQRKLREKQYICIPETRKTPKLEAKYHRRQR